MLDYLAGRIEELKKEKKIKIKMWAVIDRNTGKLENLDDRPAIFRKANQPMAKMEDFIKISGKVVPCSIIYEKQWGEDWEEILNLQKQAIEDLICQEILIAQKENQPTSRLTSLAIKVKNI